MADVSMYAHICLRDSSDGFIIYKYCVKLSCSNVSFLFIILIFINIKNNNCNVDKDKDGHTNTLIGLLFSRQLPTIPLTISL